MAGALLIHENLVGDRAKKLVLTKINSLVGADEGPPDSAEKMPRPLFTKCLLREMGIYAQDPKELGHDVIYSASVLNALDVLRLDPWKSLLEGLIALVRLVKSSGPGWITVNGINENRPLFTAVEMAGTDYWTRFAQFERPRAMEIGDMQLGHLLTHGHAIEMLRNQGAKPLIDDLDLAYRKRVHGLQTANLEERAPIALRRKAIDPRREEYWGFVDSLGDMDGHAIKYAYSFLSLRKKEISEVDLEAFGRIVWPALPASALE